MAIAIGRSNPEPSFFISAGARFTTTFSMGKRYPEFLMAVFTRSLLSFTDISGIPTI